MIATTAAIANWIRLRMNSPRGVSWSRTWWDTWRRRAALDATARAVGPGDRSRTFGAAHPRLSTVDVPEACRSAGTVLARTGR
ncbi:hypothetical protein NUM_50290 [Actinocatenispora comari]|uniref:Uncharacterized protein n=1 Tax=Actinocatenispora comari TaxID=2807577 RepID=A0A8J4AFN1_9ACTN|nr:hypothetical protein NUM_50290 [Actinocatenispora comari]